MILVADFFGLLGLDELKSSHPVSTIIEDPNEIEQIFDGISYTKGTEKYFGIVNARHLRLGLQIENKLISLLYVYYL